MAQQYQFLDFIARLCLVLLFPLSALNKIFDHQSAMAQAAHGWIPLPPSVAELMLVLGGMLEVIGPVCILLGFYRRQAALLFIFYVVATAILFHNFWNFPFNGDAWNQNFWPFLKKLWVGRWLSLHCSRRKDAVAARRLLDKLAVGTEELCPEAGTMKEFESKRYVSEAPQAPDKITRHRIRARHHPFRLHVRLDSHGAGLYSPRPMPR